MNLKKVEGSGLSKTATQALKSMRQEMMTSLKETLKDSTEQEIREVLEYSFRGKYPEDEVLAAAHEAAQEVTKLRSDPGTYLVDSDSGKLLFKMTSDMVFTPPDSMGEDGSPRKQLPMLHPKISSGIALLNQEVESIRKIEKMIPPGMTESIAHLKDPWRIVDVATANLKAKGLAVGPGDCKEEMVLEIGKENSAGIVQAPNFNFHRTEVFGKVLCQKIIDSGAKSCDFISINKKRNSKQTWFEVRVLHSKF